MVYILIEESAQCWSKEELGTMKKIAFGIVALLVIITASCEGDNDIVVTFDGTECKVSGPSEIEIGEQIFVGRNLSDLDANFTVVRVATETGITWQDHLDYWEEVDNWFFELDPPWSRYVPHSMVSTEGDEEVWEYKFISEGLYAIEWWTTMDIPRDVWVCPPLEVKEAAAE
jgi:hypothetical protein